MLKKIVLWIVTAFFLCSVAAEEVVPSAPSAAPAAIQKTYYYGRFKVEVGVDGKQNIWGGKFVPEAKLPLTPSKVHVIFVDYSTKELSYYRQKANGEYEPVVGYAVVAPHRNTLPLDVVRGVVSKVVHKPLWCPLQDGEIRRAYPKLPKGCLPHGHPLHAMGDYRFDVTWDVLGYELIKLHGASGYPAGSFWDEDTFGCTRLENKALAELVEALTPGAVASGIEIILLRGTQPLAYLAE